MKVLAGLTELTWTLRHCNLNINPFTSMHVIMKYCKKSLFLFLYIVTSVSLSISFNCWRRDPRSSTNCLGTYQITGCIMVIRDHPIITKPCVIGKIWMYFRKQRIKLNVNQYSACLHNFLCLSVCIYNDLYSKLTTIDSILRD